MSYHESMPEKQGRREQKPRGPDALPLVGDPKGSPPPFERLPAELTAWDQWVAWSLEGTNKIPIDAVTLRKASVTRPETFSSFETALAAYHHWGLGIGLVLTEEDPYCCIDLDHCVEAQGQVDGRTRAILDLMQGYVELSPSGTGLHIWVKHKTGEPVNRRTHGVEVYSHSRWMTVTGRANPKGRQDIPARPTELALLIQRYFSDRFQRAKGDAEDDGLRHRNGRGALWASRHQALAAELPPPPMEAPAADAELWQQLFQSANGTLFQALYAGDTAVCQDDHSLGVLMLANHLVWVTGGDAARVKRLLYQTGLVRDKWQERRPGGTWLDHQIADALVYVARRRR